MVEVFAPYCRVLGPQLEVQFTEQKIKSLEDQEKRDIIVFGVGLLDPVNVDVWVHEFTEWTLTEIIPYKKNRGAIAHVLASLHTYSGKEDWSTQTPEEFIKNLPRSKYKCLVHKVAPQKRLDRFLIRQIATKED